MIGGFTYLQNDFIRGDSNGDGIVNIADGIYLRDYLFVPPSPPPTCFDSADVNDDGGLDISDIIFVILFQFTQGAPPPAPYPNCDADPTADGLDCQMYSPCP